MDVIIPVGSLIIILQRRGARHASLGKTARETAVTALRLQENCDDHAEKKGLKIYVQPLFCVCIMGS